MKDGLITNGPLETWMDTSCGESNRSGVRVEIQALYLSMLRLAEFLNRFLELKNAHEYKQQDHEMKTLIKQRLMIDGTLLDGADNNGNPDMSIRPNIFLAYYACPHLLKKDEWIKTFDKVINECYLDWGGFSSISKNHPLFQANHTGINNQSHHHGDSWYYINNIAAFCLHDLDAEKYADKIAKIAEASKNEMLFSGFLGSCAELSSASHQSSDGCLCQAWSAATLIELLSKLK